MSMRIQKGGFMISALKSRWLVKLLVSSLMTGLCSGVAQAASPRGGGGMSSGGNDLGINLALVNTSQANMNTLISRANTRVGGISTPQMNNAYEASLQYGYRFSGTIYEILFRPSYFYQKVNGSGTGGDFNYGLTGYTLFPILRLYPLENDFMHFFVQVGLGYGVLNGSIQEGAASVTFSGQSFGSLVGLGSEFCFTSAHCMVIETNFRYLLMARNLADGASGSFQGNSLSQATVDHEVELDGIDFQTTMSGLIVSLGYAFHF